MACFLVKNLTKQVSIMDKKTLTYIVLAMLLLLGVSLFWNYKQYRDLQEKPEVVRDSVTIIEYKETKDSLPTAKTESVVGSIKVPIPKKKKDVDAELSQSVPDSFPNLSQTVPDTESEDSLELEITQKVYSDSTYTAYVSGYRPNLDSIFVRQKVITNTIHETRTIEAKKFRRWNVGLIGGYGYGFQSKTFEPFIGVGLTISLF